MLLENFCVNGTADVTFPGATEAEAGAMPIKALCKKHNITDQTFFRWRNKFGGMDVPDARRLKDLESENSRLKRLVAE